MERVPSARVGGDSSHNLDPKVVRGFGEEWRRFDQNELSASEHRTLFESYFAIFPWHRLAAKAIGADVGCGSGRWAKLVAPRVGCLHCVDASPDALAVAKRSLADVPNVDFYEASVDNLPFADGSLDFAYSLGVLHHVPDTRAAVKACVDKLKPNAPFLIYLYYALDNRPAWFRSLWRLSNAGRVVISRLPSSLRNAVADSIAAAVYWPLARFSRVLERTGVSVEGIPLAAYRRCSFYTMRTDALDRFGTRLESRFTRREIADMMADAGLTEVAFSDAAPFWCAVGVKMAR